jgi:hypothetical protein
MPKVEELFAPAESKETLLKRSKSKVPFGYFGNHPQIETKPHLGTCPQWSWVWLKNGSKVWDRDSEDND